VIPAADGSLLERLRELRRRLSSKERIPAYRVLHDRTLEALARQKPTTRAALLEVHGIGEAKLARYGDALLAVLRGAGSRAAP
jgi:superfamily II DNA helicase RecQ